MSLNPMPLESEAELTHGRIGLFAAAGFLTRDDHESNGPAFDPLDLRLEPSRALSRAAVSVLTSMAVASGA